jgi:hypothetical protein
LPTAHIEGVRHGKLISMTVDQYSARVSGRPEADQGSHRRAIDRIEVSGNSAIARATLVQGGFTATDFFLLLKVEAGWRIANKTFYSEPTR